MTPRYFVCLLFLECDGGPCSAWTKPARIWFHVDSNSRRDTRIWHMRMHAQLLYRLLLAILLLLLFFFKGETFTFLVVNSCLSWLFALWLSACEQTGMLPHTKIEGRRRNHLELSVIPALNFYFRLTPHCEIKQPELLPLSAPKMTC